MSNTNKKKTAQLGMPLGTAANRLRKIVLFSVLQRHQENVCFRCGEAIDSASELSLDHKIGWMDNDPSLFWDIANIAFAHLVCNSRAANRHSPAKLAHYEALRLRNTLPAGRLKPSSVERYNRMKRNGITIPHRRPLA